MGKEILLFFGLILLMGFIFAVPSLPHNFIGTVEYSGDSGMSLTGYDISAKVGSWQLGVLDQVQSGNNYEVFVDPQGHTGEITFYIGGIEASPTHEYEWGGNTENFDLVIDEMPSNIVCGNGIQEPGEQCDNLDLGTGTCENVLGIQDAIGTLSCTDICTFDYSNCSAPFCGDDVCNNGETCSTCPADCGKCKTNNNGNTGGSCFPAGIKITMADGSLKNIEEIIIGDYVMSYDEEHNKNVLAEVLELENPVRDHMCEIVFIDDEKLKLTNEHPVYTEHGWKSINPQETLKENFMLIVFELKQGDRVLFNDLEYKEIKNIQCWKEIVQTYNLKSIKNYNNFYAENILVHNKGGGGNPPSNTNTTNDTIKLNIETEDDEILSIDELNEISETSSGITGAVIGFVKSGTGMVLIFALLIIGIGVMTLRKRASKNE